MANLIYFVRENVNLYPKCPTCGYPLSYRELLTCPTTSPESSDVYNGYLMCDNCEYCEPFISSDDNEDN